MDGWEVGNGISGCPDAGAADTSRDSELWLWDVYRLEHMRFPRNRDGRKESAAGYTWQCLWLALALGALASTLHWATKPIFTEIGHEFEVYEQEVAYFQITIFAVLPQFVAATLSNFFFAVGKTVAPMITGIGHVILNFVLNYVLMFGIPGVFEGMGIAGAAWGTLIASLAWAVALFLLFLFSPKLQIHKTRQVTFSLSRLRNLLKLGVPNGAIDLVDIIFWNVALVLFIGNFERNSCGLLISKLPVNYRLSG